MVKEGKIANIVRVILVMAAVAITSFGLYRFTEIGSVKDHSTNVKAHISKVETEIGVTGDTEYIAYVSYKYEDGKYEDMKLSYYKSYMYEGYEIKDFYVNNDNPKSFIIESDESFMPKILIIIGIGVIVIVVVTIIIGKQKKKKLLNLKNVGIKKDGIIGSGKEDITYAEKGKHPYRFECFYEDEISQNPVFCTSGRTWENPDNYIGKHVDIYVSKNDKSFYYVDIEKVIDESKHK